MENDDQNVNLAKIYERDEVPMCGKDENDQRF